MDRPNRAGFRSVRGRAAGASSPRALFRDLTRDPAVPFLWGHQDRILERYEGCVDVADLALELPTGTGKTLIGLLIGEWRRRARCERVLYLCPTRQLAHQVGELARRYGIDARVCLAPSYDGVDAWNRGDALAISTYSALFNYRPRFAAPQSLLLDDAHAADGYIAGHWSVSIGRHSMNDAYRNLAQLLAPLVDATTAQVMADDSPNPADRNTIEMVPLPRWWPLADALRELLDDAVEDTNEWFAWRSHVRDGLAACCLYLSWREIVLRPLIPATARQSEFAGANQRVYMSATLGGGGELERVFGTRKIARLPVPDEWQSRSTGRRLFLMPSASLDAAEADRVVERSIRAAGRAVVLAPSREAVDARRQKLADAGIEILDATDIEESLQPFTSRDSAVLLLANRYDGIDLPGEDCRLLILDGLPVSTNPHEQFLYQRLAANTLLSERMRTRLTQGVGRATRGEGDWCAVVVGSRDAHDFCARGDVRSLLHPDLQGELRFGLAQSESRDVDDFLDLLEVLLDHGDEWRAAEEEIRQLRDESTRGVDPAAAALERTAGHEVDFTYAMWDRDFPRAVELALRVAESLDGDKAAPYRAWWLYQAGAAAWMAHHVYNALDASRSRELFRRAVSTGRSVHWFAELAYGGLSEEAEQPLSVPDLKAAERVQSVLRSIGYYGKGLSRRAGSLQKQLDGLESTPWEEGITELGRLLGFDSTRPGGQNDPDSVWIATDHLAVVWELKSEEGVDGEIGARTAQQAAGHVAWIKARGSLAPDAAVLAVLVSDRTRLGEGADVHADDVRVASLDTIRSIARETIAAISRVRAVGQQEDDAGLRAHILRELSAAALLPSCVCERLSTTRLASLDRR